MRLFFVFFGCLLVSCNYNYHLGTILEKDGKFEEASTEYSRAYFQDLSNQKYQVAYKRNALKVVEVLKATYQKQLINKNFFSAYKILEKATQLNTQNLFFQQELKKWRFLLLSGKIDYSKGKHLNELFAGDKIYPIVRFNSPFSRKTLEATINVNGEFFLEDLLYTPATHSYMLYTIDSIGFKYLPFQEKNTAFIDSDNFAYLSLINFYKPTLMQDQKEFINDKIQQKIQNNFFDESYWYPKRGITYSSKIIKQKIFIRSSSAQTSFLPLFMYQKQQRIFLDFGTITLRRKERLFIWGVARKKENQETTYAAIKNNYYYRIYEKTLENTYHFVRQ